MGERLCRNVGKEIVEGPVLCFTSLTNSAQRQHELTVTISIRQRRYKEVIGQHEEQSDFIRDNDNSCNHKRYIFS